ncbi:TonB-dependent receptor [Lysobacter pythonis]|uniref:TonB-dependent receptor n=1 Tax=Solilutibacter pythonis TaxID=2483112 RepID=A0A3M2HTC4_9GAMM|nr:TonB-dependent receptor [Lysobacter pythonis]RMH90920.1 TonB-dependent receptor [Lysobacter pythonis]
MKDENLARLPIANPRTTRIARAVCAALLCSIAMPALARQSTPDDEDTSRNLDRVIVIGSIPKPMPINTGEVRDATLDARRAAARDTAQLLADVPGVSVQNAGGVSALPSIHGLTGDRNRVQVDGMDILASCPNHMNPPLSYIAPSGVGAIKVHAGIAPVSAGGDSIGGSIQVQSLPPRFADDGGGWQFGGHLGAQYRSNGDARSANAALTLANADWSLGYEGSVAHAENYRAGGDFRAFTDSGREGHDIRRDEVGSSAYLVRNQKLTAAFRHDAHLVQASFARQEIPRQGYPNQRMDMLANTQNRWQLAYQGDFGWGAVEARVWQERLRHSMGFGPDRQYWYGRQSMVPGTQDYTRPCSPIGPACAADMPMETASRTRAATLAMSLNLREADVLRLGAEWQQYALDDWWPPSGGGMWPDSFWNIRDGRRNRASFYAEWEGRFSPAWSALIGLRHDVIRTRAGTVQGYDTDPAPPGSYMMTARDDAAFNAGPRHRRDRHFDATALLRWTPAKTLDIEAGLAHKTRTPNLYERYAWSTWAMAAIMNNTAGDGNGYVGNPELAPEKATTAAISLDWHGEGSQPSHRLRVTPWATRVDDYVDALMLPLPRNGRPNQFNVLRFANQSARLYGVDLAADARLAEGDFGRFDLKAIANWQRGENRDTRQPLYNVMPPNARLTLGHRLGGWESGIELQGVQAKTRVSTVRNEVPTPGYGLLHLRGAYTWKQWRFDLGVENVFNRLYALPTGGLYLGQGRTMGINAIAWGIPVPGPGRSFYAAVKWSL